MRTHVPRHVRFSILISLFIAAAVPVFLAVASPQQQVSASNDGPRSIPGFPVIVRGIPNTGKGFFIPPPAPKMRISPNAPKAASFNITYSSNFPTEARTAFQYAVNIWAGLLDSPVTINIMANWISLGNGVLGSAGTMSLNRNFPGAPAANTWFPDALTDKRTCSSYGGMPFDIVANFNSDINLNDWYFGTDGAVLGDQWDFATVALGELAHGFGFASSFTTIDGGDGYWDHHQDPDIGTPEIYTRFVRDGTSTETAIISYTSPSGALASALRGHEGGLFWTGQFATAGNGGTQPTLYSPNTWRAGSSFSHFDQATYVTELMNPDLPQGVAIHNPGPRTLGVLRDIGWGDELVIHAFGYDTSRVVEWVQLRNNASVPVNLSDYAIGDEEDQSTTDEGMFMLPNVDVAPGALFTMRVRSDGDWTTAYPGDPNPTYCWNCTSGYTNLTQYSLWGGTSGTLDDAGDEIVLLRTNGGTADLDGTLDDFITDALCYGSGQTYVDTNGSGSLNGRDKYIFTDSSCLGLLASGSFQRNSPVEACVPSTALTDNPTAVSVESIEASALTADQPAPASLWPLSVMAMLLLASGLIIFRSHSNK